VAGLNAASSNNLASDATGTTHSPAGGGMNSVVATASPTVCGTVCVGFVSITALSENLHLIATTYTNQAVNTAATLATVFVRDIEDQVRPFGAWDIGADERDATTAVKLQAFSARPFSGAVRVEWETASELENLGFHVYRGLSGSGPWTRLNTSLISGLGSSAVGRAYSWLDSGLTNGVRYFYRLEDVDASSKSTSHGPVSAVPMAGLSDGTAGSGPGASGGAATRATASPTCPEWVVSAYGSLTGSSRPQASLACTRHGDPESVSLQVLSRDSRSATLELRTGGFYALREAAGKVRIFVPGFDFPEDPQAAAVPFRRALVEGVVGRRAQIGGVRGLEQVSFAGLVPSSLGKAEMQLASDGTVKAGRRALREPEPQHVSV
jgi:hypothetical protein